MDSQTIINILIGVSGVFGGWTLNNITKAIERLDDDVRSMPDKYVTKDTYHRDIDELKDICGKIFDRLEGKADK